MRNIKLDDYIESRLGDASFKKVWQDSEAQYQVTRALIQARLEKNLSQRSLARKSKTTQAVISRIENMSMSPSLQVLEKLAGAMGKKLEVNFVNW